MMKQFLKYLLNQTGYEIKKVNNVPPVDFDPNTRPVGSFKELLQNVKTRGLACQAVLDVGAHRANWSRIAKEVYPDASFYLIEPQIELKEDLEQFCREVEKSAYFLAGAGAKQDTLTLTIWEDLGGSSFLPKPDSNLKEIGKQREIQIIAIDDLLDTGKIEYPEIIKLDIQGFELEALKGAEKTFGFTEVYILEVSLFSFNDVPGMPIFADVVNFMLERDYVVYDFPGFLKRPLDGALGQCDVCFVKKNGLLRRSNDWM